MKKYLLGILLAPDSPAGSGAPKPPKGGTPNEAADPNSQAALDRMAQLESEHKILKNRLTEANEKLNAAAQLQSQFDEVNTLLTTATGKLAGYEAADAARKEDELLISQKMEMGLTRSQAIAVITRQKQHDAAVQATWTGRRAKLLGVIEDAENLEDALAKGRKWNNTVSAEELAAAVQSKQRKA